MNSPDPVALVARRLALPEREPDDAFVLRVDRLIDVTTAERAAARARREQVVVELFGAAALFLCARELLAAGDGAAELVLPLVADFGGLALVAATLVLFLTLVTAEATGRMRAS